MSSKDKQIAVTLKKSLIARKENHKACARGLGLKRLNQTVMVADTPENRGMINKISYLLEIQGDI